MTESPEFVHLHVHSEYSLLDGLSSVDELVSEAKRLGMSAMALTDHGAMYGAIDFYLAAKAASLKPILGVETYVAPRGMADREAKDRQYHHLILLAKNEEGYGNLLQLVTRANLDGFFYKPRVDHELLARHHQGLIALSACYSGEPARAILNGDPSAAREAAAWYRDVFGRDDYYLEVQDHSNDDDRKVNQGLIPIARDLGIPLVATNDLHYARQEQAAAQDTLLCIQTNATIDDPARMRMQPAEFYLKSPQQMAQLFAELPEALRSTVEIAERCDLKLRFDRLNFPELTHIVPEGETAEEYLARVCREQLPQRYRQVGGEPEARLEYELSVIQKTGFSRYILFVWDFVDWARRRGIQCGPRGSAAGSIVLYCLGVSQLDPLAYGLTFERFLNPERIQMPDIDMDFADDRREEVIQYVVQRYGRDHVAQIITFGRLAARAAIRDVGRTMSYPLNEIDRVAKLIPALPVGMSIQQALQQSRELQQLYETQPHVKKLIDAARSVEGVARHAGTHAAGVVVSGDPLVKHVPLQRAGKSEHVMTQYHMKDLEKIGLLKMDFLGLANLTMLERAVKNVEEVRGLRLDLGALPLDDQRAYEMLARGETNSVFQLEGAGMTRYLKELRPTTIDHLAAMVALYRPGPMAHIPTYIACREGREAVRYADPSLEPILKDTYGILVYQDQVLQVVRTVAGYSLGQADILRRAMGKKLAEEMKKERKNFLAGAKRQGYSEEVASRLWEYIEPFAGYAFNRAHAYCYALVAYQTAYLKASFPVEWMAAVLTTEALDTDKVVSVVGECRRIGIPVLPPDVNRSQPRFAVEWIDMPGGGDLGPGASAASPGPGSSPPPLEPRPLLGIRYGLAAIKNVGEGAVQVLIQERDRNGLFNALEDLCRRVDLKTLNKRVLESLIKAGALDGFGRREQLLAGLDQAMAAGQQRQRAQSLGQGSLFDAMGEGGQDASASLGLPEVPAVAPQQRLVWEKETLGLFLSDHPYQQASRWLASRVTANTSQLGPELAGEKLVLAGIIASVRRLTTKKGESMAVAELEDLHGTIEVVVFPRLFQKTADLWREDRIVIIEGKLDPRDDRRQIICDAIEEWLVPQEGEPPPLLEAQGSNGHRNGEALGDETRERPGQGENGAAALSGSPSLPHAVSSGHAPGQRNGTETRVAPAAAEGPATLSGPDVPPSPNASPPGGSASDDLASPLQGEGPVSAPAPPPTPAARLVLTLARSKDEVADIRQLEELHNLLEVEAGDTPYELYLSVRGRRVRISSPGATLQRTPQLEESLRRLLGSQHVRVVQS